MTIFFRSEKLIRDGEGCSEIKKASQMRSFSVSFFKTGLFFPAFHVFRISVHEFVNTPCGVNQFHFPSIKWM